jgi:AraC-like DNA-binding protein
MGRSIFQIYQEGALVERVTERVTIIPRRRQLVVKNTGQKIVILLDGAVTALVNKRVVGRMEQGDALVIPGPCRQAYVPLVSRRELRMRALVITFKRDIFPCDEGLLRAMPLARANPEKSPEDFIRNHFGSVQLRTKVLTPPATALLEGLRSEAEGKGMGYQLRIAALSLLLLTEIARGESAAATVTGGVNRQAWIAEQAKHFLLEHHSEGLTLDQVAWHLRLSAEHLARTFRRETGQTVFAFLQHLRLAHAKTQLVASQLGVSEIARQTGFGSATQLCRTFKRVTGKSPLAYRLRMAAEATFSPSTTEKIVKA